MSKSIVAFGHIIEGKLIIHKKKHFDEQIAQLNGDCRIEVELGRKRSLEFNRYWWGAMNYVAERLEGWTPFEVHEHTKAQVNFKMHWLVNHKTGEMQEVRVVLPTHDLTTTRFLELKEAAMQYWAEQGISIPDEYWTKEAA